MANVFLQCGHITFISNLAFFVVAPFEPGLTLRRLAKRTILPGLFTSYFAVVVQLFLRRLLLRPALGFKFCFVLVHLILA